MPVFTDLFEKDDKQRILIRQHDAGYAVYDYPRDAAESLANSARKLFENEFLSSQSSVGIALEGLSRIGQHAHLQERGTPVLNVQMSKNYGTFVLIAEGPNGEIALEYCEYLGSQRCDNAEFNRVKYEIKGTEGAILSTLEELTNKT